MPHACIQVSRLVEAIHRLTKQPVETVDRLALRRAAHGLAELSKTGESSTSLSHVMLASQESAHVDQGTACFDRSLCRGEARASKSVIGA